MRTRATIITITAVFFLAIGGWASGITSHVVSWQNEQALPPGSRLAISNDSGPISVTGWDKDTLQAGIAGERDPAAVKRYQQQGRPRLTRISGNPAPHPRHPHPTPTAPPPPTPHRP